MDLDKIKQVMKIKSINPDTYSPLVLAYIGDSVYELIIRNIAIGTGNTQVNKLQKKSSSLAKAATQADIIRNLEKDLTEKERNIFKRGRNAKSVTTAKNASMVDYRYATGFECLIGYLYLTNQVDRLLELVKQGFESVK